MSLLHNLIDWTHVDGRGVRDLGTTSFPSKRSAGYKDGGQLNLSTSSFKQTVAVYYVHIYVKYILNRVSVSVPK